MLTIVASMQRELSGLEQALNRNLGPGHGQALCVIGIGPGRAAEGLTGLLASPSSRAASGSGTRLPVLLLGFAGALSPDLNAGDLILASAYHRQPATAAQGQPPGSLSPDPGMMRLAARAAEAAGLAVNNGPALTVDALVREPAEKRRLHQNSPVDPRTPVEPVTSVNMEDHAVAEVAAQAGAAFLSARVILDTSEQRLPGYLIGLTGSGPHAAASTLIRHWRIPMLLSLAFRMRRAQNTLCRFGLAFIQQFEEFGDLVEQGAPDSTGERPSDSLQPSQRSAQKLSGAVGA